MTDDRKSGIAFIAGSLGEIITMAVHPTAGLSALTPELAAHLAITSAAAHSLAILCAILLFLGACGLFRRISAPDRLAFSALIIFGFASVAIVIAAGISGFVAPSIMSHMVRDVSANALQWKISIVAIFQINQAFARIYSVAASIAIILWSVSALRNGGFGRGVATYGCVISPLVILGVAIGHLQVDVHGMAAIVLAEAIWFIIVGSQIAKHAATPSASAA